MQRFVYCVIILCLTASAHTRSTERMEIQAKSEENDLLATGKFSLATSAYNARKDSCSPNPCENNGECNVKEGKIYCICQGTYLGPRCEIECKCENGKCEEINRKAICVCNPQHGLYDEGVCKACECGYKGNCTFDISLPSDGKECICQFGLDESTGKCKDPCQPNPCKNEGECKDARCFCPRTHYGKLCEICKCDNGFCEEADDGKTFCKCPPEWDYFSPTACQECNCGYGGNCTFTVDDWLRVTKTCFCKEGFNDFNGICKGTCKPNPCRNGGQCSVEGEAIKCKCDSNFDGELCEKVTCDPDPCKNFGYCYVKDEKIYCSCRGNYGGDRCEKNLCLPDPCNFRGECGSRNGTLLCNCRSPYGGKACEKNLCHPNPCLNKGKCSVTEGVITCSCVHPFVGDRCERDICDPNPCLNDGNCTSVNGSVSCSCEDGFSGKTCEMELCSTNPCLNDGECIVTSGQVSCVCRDTFSGEKCETDLCAPNPCMNGGNCTVKNGTVDCVCEDTFVGDKCETDLCAPNPCLNGGRCYVTNGTVACFCKDPFTGDRCQIVSKTPIAETDETRDMFTSVWTESSDTSKAVNDTTVESHLTTVTKLEISTTSRGSCAVNPCQNEGICKPEGNGEKCYCIAPFTGELCEKDPCSANPCMKGGLCKVDALSFVCECTSPYYGTLCEKDPCTAKPCQNGGTCFISGNGFECECKTPFAGVTCGIDPCFWNPCKNGGICKVVEGDSKCFCTDHFSGDFCESRLEIDGNIITFAAVSVILVIILILVSCILRQRFQVFKTSGEEK